MLKYLFGSIFKHQRSTVSHGDFRRKLIFSLRQKVPKWRVWLARARAVGYLSCCDWSIPTAENADGEGGAGRRSPAGGEFSSGLHFQEDIFMVPSVVQWCPDCIIPTASNAKAYLKITLKAWPQITNSRKFWVRVETLSLPNLPLGPVYCSLFDI